MSDKNREDSSSERNAARFDTITPIEFTPTSGQKKGVAFRFRIKHFFILGFVMLAAGSGWFVLNAKSVYVQVEPITAQRELSGFAIGLGQRYLVLAGDYTISLTHPGYYDYTTTLTVTDEPAQDFPFQLEELPGLVTVQVSSSRGDIADARVIANGELLALSSLAPIELVSGSYKFEVLADRYLPLRRNVMVQGRQTLNELSFVLEQAWADVSFATEPQGADVFVDGQLIGKTPYTTEVLQGSHDLTLKLAGHKAWQDRFEVEAGGELAVPRQILEPADGLAFIRSIPSGASVTVNGQYIGLSPTEVALAPGQTHEISLFKSGFEAAQRRIQARSDEEQNIEVALKAITSVVKIVVAPAQAQLYIDGDLKGNANQKVELLAATQTIEIRADGYIPYTTQFTSRPGLEQELRIELTSLEQARLDATEPVITTVAGQTLPLFYPGQFTMGASRREAGRRANEDLREIKLERPFYLSNTEVSNEQYKRFRPGHSSGTMQNRSLDLNNQPVVLVSWQDAALYCNWLSAQEGLPPFYVEENGTIAGFNADSAGYRLPSEAEWEWAARTDTNGSIHRYSWGDNLPPPAGSGNFADQSVSPFMGQYIQTLNDGFAGTSPVGAFNVNERGMYDMAGNVSEWVHDFYGTQLSINSSVEIDPLGPSAGAYHTVKGSSWAHSAVTELRLSYRDFADEPRNDLGFRIARYLED